MANSALSSAHIVAMVERSSIDNAPRPSAPNSTEQASTLPTTSASARNTSLPDTPSAFDPVNVTRTDGGTWNHVDPVHTIWTISRLPNPRAAQFNAPLAQECESAHASTWPGSANARSSTIWCEIPWAPTSARSAIPNSAANCRAARWASASTSVGAGTAWSRTIETRDGSNTTPGNGEPPPNCKSIITTRSTEQVTISPGRTTSTPAWAARIRSTTVIGVFDATGIVTPHRAVHGSRAASPDRT